MTKFSFHKADYEELKNQLKSSKSEQDKVAETYESRIKEVGLPFSLVLVAEECLTSG